MWCSRRPEMGCIMEQSQGKDFDGSIETETSSTVKTLYRRKIQAPVSSPKYSKQADTGQQLVIAPLQVQLPLL